LNPVVIQFLEDEIKNERANLQNFATDLIDAIEESEEEIQEETALFKNILEEAKSEAKSYERKEEKILAPIKVQETIQAKKETAPKSKRIQSREKIDEKIEVAKTDDIQSFTRNILENFEFQKKISLKNAPSTFHSPEKPLEKTLMKESLESKERQIKTLETQFYKKPKKEEKPKDEETKREEAISNIQDFTKHILKQFDLKKKMAVGNKNE